MHTMGHTHQVLWSSRRFSHVLTADAEMAGFTALHTELGFAGISRRPPLLADVQPNSQKAVIRFAF